MKQEDGYYNSFKLGGNMPPVELLSLQLYYTCTAKVHLTWPVTLFPSVDTMFDLITRLWCESRPQLITQCV